MGFVELLWSVSPGVLGKVKLLGAEIEESSRAGNFLRVMVDTYPWKRCTSSATWSPASGPS